MTDGTGTTTYTYDDFNRILTKNVPDFGLCEYVYDITLSMPTGCTAMTFTDSQDNVVEKRYDRNGRLYEVIADGMTTTYTYYANGCLQSVEYDDGSSETYTFTDDNLLSTLINRKADQTIIDSEDKGTVHMS